MAHQLDVPERLKKLLLSGRLYRLPKGQVFQTSGYRDSPTYVTKGFVKRYSILNDGALSVQIIYGPGNFFPLTVVYKALFGQNLYDGPEVFYYETMCETVVYSLDINTLQTSIDKDPLLYSDLLAITGQRIFCFVHGLENQSLKTAYQRVAHQLAFYAGQFSQTVPVGKKILIPLTHQDLADILGLTRETVSHSIKALRQKKLLSGSEQLIITDLQKLQAEAYNNKS